MKDLIFCIFEVYNCILYIFVAQYFLSAHILEVRDYMFLLMNIINIIVVFSKRTHYNEFH